MRKFISSLNPFGSEAKKKRKSKNLSDSIRSETVGVSQPNREIQSTKSATSGATPLLRPKLSELAAQISANAKIVEDYIESHGSQYPSFAADGPSKFPLPAPDSAENIKVHEARNALLTASKYVYDLTKGPDEHIQWIVWNFNDVATLNVIASFDIPEIVPLEGDISFAEISLKINVPIVKIRQVLRLAMTNHIFCEPRHGYVAHTAASRYLKDNPAMLGWVMYNAGDLSQGYVKLVESLQRFPQSGNVDEAPFALAHNENPFQFFGTHPEKAERFGAAMGIFSSGPGFAADYLVKGYAWDSLPKDATIVDVGGGIGFTSMAIAQANPGFKFIVEDKADPVLKIGESMLDPATKERFQFVPHDFFTEQPIKGADAYLLRWCLHDWSDSYAVQIVKSLIPALKNGSKIIINEIALPEANTLSPWEERRVRLMDMVMLASFNSCEREKDEWEKLLAEADPRLRFDGVNRAPGALMSVVEATFIDP